MNTTRGDEYSQRTPPYLSQKQNQNNFTSSDQDDLITEQWRSDGYSPARRSTTKRTSRSYSGHVARQKSRRREIRSRQPKHQITVDTSFTTHRGRAPREVFPEGDDRIARLTRKQSWFVRRLSGQQKGLGIMKGTPQPEVVHRSKQSVDRNEPMTAVSQASARTFPDISPWDRPIPIGISVPTDSVPDFSPYQGHRYRSGSDATLVTPSIVVTPAVPMQSVWSPDTPFSESDYTPSTFSYKPGTFNIPPMPALPANMSKSSGAPTVQNISTHNRSDTLDSAGTAFEEDDDMGKKARVMSTATVFEEDMTPLRDQTIETTLALDTTIVPTPRRSQGWWNLITTPFITTPNTATFPKNGQHGVPSPEVPRLPTHYYTSEDAPASPSTYTWSAADSASLKPSLSTAVTTPETKQVEQVQIKEQNSSLAVVLEEHHHNHTNIVQAMPANAMHLPAQNEGSLTRNAAASPSSATSTPPVLNTATIGTVLMPRQVKEQQHQNININIELQDHRHIAHSQAVNGTGPSALHATLIDVPAPQKKVTETTTIQFNSSQQAPPSFAPPPTSAQKGSHFSYDDKRSSSPTATADLKTSKKPSKFKEFLMRFLPLKKKKQHKKLHKSEEEKKKKKKKTVCFWGCCCCLIFLILLAVLIPVIIVLTLRHKKATVTQGVGYQWLNLPNYPAAPTGISTIAQPEPVVEQSGCVAPTTLWSCALPKELQASIAPNQPDQPNFEIQITYQNGSTATIPRRAANPVSARAFMRSQRIQARSAPTPSPAPPSDAEMTFLGQTTDGNSAPYDGEDTPLFITMINPQGTKVRLAKRQNSQNSSDPTNITAVIPPPMLNPDGSAAPANLLPYPSAQPLRLFNRGKDNEYYGFYTFYDRSIFLKDINGTNRGGNPADTNGGSPKDAATLRCTFAQTRFLVQIWTQSQQSKPLLQRSASNATSIFSRPGTFPYPVTITIDRHGGNPATKNLYCYDIESDSTIKNNANNKFFEFEDRAFGGNLVNGTQGDINATGPIDGGTGGCSCKWQNWLGN